NVVLFHNIPKKERRQILSKYKKEGGVLLTSYGMIVSQNASFVRMDLELDHIFLDEGHKIKNPKIKISSCLKKLKTKRRIVLTGTPIQNNLKELWALCDYLFTS